MENTIIYPGSFDPPTKGHVDLVNRALTIFDKVIVAVILNPSKKTMFDASERVRMLEDIFGDYPKVQVESFDGLLIEFAQKMNVKTLLRGLRAVSDFEYEFQMALMNRNLDPSINTVYLMPSQQFSFLSSSIIKEVYALSGDISSLVPEIVEKYLAEKLSSKDETDLCG